MKLPFRNTTVYERALRQGRLLPRQDVLDAIDVALAHVGVHARKDIRQAQDGVESLAALVQVLAERSE